MKRVHMAGSHAISALNVTEQFNNGLGPRFLGGAYVRGQFRAVHGFLARGVQTAFKARHGLLIEERRSLQMRNRFSGSIFSAAVLTFSVVILAQIVVQPESARAQAASDPDDLTGVWGWTARTENIWRRSTGFLTADRSAPKRSPTRSTPRLTRWSTTWSRIYCGRNWSCGRPEVDV